MDARTVYDLLVTLQAPDVFGVEEDIDRRRVLMQGIRDYLNNRKTGGELAIIALNLDMFGDMSCARAADLLSRRDPQVMRAAISLQRFLRENYTTGENQ